MNLIRYFEGPGDMSMARSLEEFEAMLDLACERLVTVLRPGGVLAVLIGDKRKNGEYYPLMRSLLMGNKLGRLRAILIKEQHNCRSDTVRYAGATRSLFLFGTKTVFCLKRRLNFDRGKA